MIRVIEKLMAPLKRKVNLMVGRCLLNAINDDAGVQALKIALMKSETRDQAERLQEYGFTSHPHPGAEGVAVFVGGNRDHGLIVATDDRRYRPKGLEQGEVCLYTDEDKASSDHRVIFKRNKEIHLIAGDASIVMTPAGITINTPSLDINKV